MGMTESSAQQRQLPRARQLRRGLCVFNNGSSTLDVIVRDISEKGARVVSDNLVVLPRTFELRILEAEGAYTIRSARLAWTNGKTAGLEFIA